MQGQTNGGILTPLALNPVTPALLMQLSQQATEQQYQTQMAQELPLSSASSVASSARNKRSGSAAKRRPNSFHEADNAKIEYEQMLKETLQ